MRILDCTKTRPPNCVIGIFQLPTHWNRGETHALTTGPISLIQPLIAPLYDGKSAYEMFAALQGHADKNDVTNLFGNIGNHKRREGFRVILGDFAARW